MYERLIKETREKWIAIRECAVKHDEDGVAKHWYTQCAFCSDADEKSAWSDIDGCSACLCPKGLCYNTDYPSLYELADCAFAENDFDQLVSLIDEALVFLQ